MKGKINNGNRPFEGSKEGGGFDKNPENINRKGRPKVRPLRDILEKIENEDFKITIPIGNCEVDTERGVVVIKIPSKEVIAMSLQKNAGKDVRWFSEWAKVMGEYAPTEIKQTNTDTSLEITIVKPDE